MRVAGGSPGYRRGGRRRLGYAAWLAVAVAAAAGAAGPLTKARREREFKAIVVTVLMYLLTASTVVATAIGGVSAALAATDATSVFAGTLAPQNNTGATGVVEVVVNAESLTVRVEAQGLLPDAPHAQVLVGFSSDDRDSTCPTGAADLSGDGVITATEAQTVSGPVLVGLLPRTDEASSPRADGDGRLRYARTFSLAKGTDEFNNRISRRVADDLERFVVIQLGIDRNGDGEIERLRESSALASCGELWAVPNGGVAVGTGTTAGVERAGLLAAGTAMVAIALSMLLAGSHRRPKATASRRE